jgi:hypothetical protein
MLQHAGLRVLKRSSADAASPNMYYRRDYVVLVEPAP